MKAVTLPGIIIFVFFLVFLVPGFFDLVRAERLPIKIYTSADGLRSSAVTQIFRDSKGFMWFSTRDGVSRFDGRQFSNYRLRDDDLVQNVYFVYETRDGSFWISANDGLYLITPEKTDSVEPKKTVEKGGREKINARKVMGANFTVLFEDEAGNLWAGGGNGLFLIKKKEDGDFTSEQVMLGEAANAQRGIAVTSILEGPDKSLWVGCFNGLIRRTPDGRIILYRIDRISNLDGVYSLAQDEQGRIFIAHGSGLFVLNPEPLEALADQPNFSIITSNVSTTTVEKSAVVELPSAPGAMSFFILRQGKLDTQFTSVTELFRAFDGKIWAAVGSVLYTFDGNNVNRLDDENGIMLGSLTMTEDLAGNLWLGTSSGVAKLTRLGLTTFTRVDNIFPPDIHSIHETPDGRLFVVHGDWRISEVTSGGIVTKRLAMPDSVRSIWASRVAVPGDDGAWWALSSDGLYLFNSIDATQPEKIFREADGLKSNTLFCGFRDSKGDYWFSTRLRDEKSGLSRYDSKTRTFHPFGAAENYPLGKAAMTFAEDSNGDLWFGFYESGLTRFRNGRFTTYTADDGAPIGNITSLHIDKKGRLWIASGLGGVGMVADPRAEKLEFKNYTTADGLTTNNNRTITEDLEGNIYIGSVHGITRLTPETGEFYYFSPKDGLAADFVVNSLTDSHGTLWFGTPNGFSRLVTEKLKPQPPPSIFINGLQIAGVDYRISPFGQTRIGQIDLGYTQNNLQINFLSVGGDDVRYQYKLEGAGDEWSAPTLDRSVNFANLAPGAYKFWVRAVNNKTEISREPAVLSFTITPPFWRTWWFLGLVILIAAGAIFGLDRYRVSKTNQVKTALAALKRSKKERLAELERVRTRIATDLHDDIGASLTQIAVLSEVARSQLVEPSTKEIHPLNRISDVSNELIETMSDIVWAINPHKDNLRDLVQKMRRFAADLFVSRKIKFEFKSPPVEEHIMFGANIRREVFAIFKECLNNCVKYSECTRTEVSLEIEPQKMRLQIGDNGVGFDTSEILTENYAPGKGGNGLRNIRRRAVELGGKCEIISFPGGGTTILLEIPLYADDEAIFLPKGRAKKRTVIE